MNRRQNKRSQVCSILLVLMTCLLCFTATVNAATYYTDAVNGNDNNSGTSGSPWQTLPKIGNVRGGNTFSEGDTCYIRDGNYSGFLELSNTDRTLWTKWVADTGHTPTIEYITIKSSFPDPAHDKYYWFEGLTVTVGREFDQLIQWIANYGMFKNMTLTGDGYIGEDGSAGLTTINSHDIIIDNCTINGVNDVPFGGSHRGILVVNCTDVNIVNCDISRCGIGMNIAGTGAGLGNHRIKVADNVLHDLDYDGLFTGDLNDCDIIDNEIYNIDKPIFLILNGSYTYTHSTKTLARQSGDAFPDSGIVTHRAKLTSTGSGAVPVLDETKPAIFYKHDWPIISSVPDGNTMVLSQSFGSDYNDITKIELASNVHCDAIQMTDSNQSVMHNNNIRIERNKIYNIIDQGFFVNMVTPSNCGSVYFRNNLIYNVATDVMIEDVTELYFINNTVVGDHQDTWQGDTAGNVIFQARTTVVEFYNNVIDQFGGITPNNITTHNNNIFYNEGFQNISYTPGDSETDLSTLEQLKALVTDYDNRDFTLAADSTAVDFGSADYAPNSDILGVSRVFPPDAGCYEYVSSGTNNAPVLQTIGNKSVSENSTLSFSINATDADSDTITYSATGLPTGATFSSQNFSWTPGYNQAGTHDVNFIASDGTDQDSETITITVSNTNRAPVLASIGNKSVNENSTLSFSVSATDADSDTITYSVQSLPSGATLGSSSGDFTWTPGYNQAGTHDVNFIASDGQAQDSENITITVNNTNRDPVLNSIGDKSVFTETSLSFTVSATDADSDTITYSATSLPSGATFSGQNFSWTPGSNQAGSYDVSFTASDSQAQDSETITITVTADTSAPTVTNLSPTADSIQAPLNSLIYLDVTDSGEGVNASTVTITVNSNLVYTGNTSDYNSSYGRCRRIGTSAAYTYVYQADESFGYDQTVTVTVNATDLAANPMDEYSYSFKTEMRSFSKNKKVNLINSSHTNPATIQASNGDLWVTWETEVSGVRDIYIGKLTSDADTFRDSVNITNNNAVQSDPAIAIDSTDKLYVTWQDYRNGEWDIYVSTSTDGINFSTERKITDPNSDQINPAIVIDSSNKAYIVWEDDRNNNQDIYIASSSNSFVSYATSQITSNASDQTSPAIAVDSGNTVYVVWTDARGGTSNIYGAASNSGPWTNVAVVSNANSQSSPAIATEASGTILHLLWVDDTSGDNDIYYVSSDGLPGSPLTGSSLIDDNSGASQSAPVITVTGSTGNDLKVFACWKDERNVSSGNSDADIYFVEVNAGSGTNVLVGDDSTNSAQSYPAMGIDGYGYPYLVWTDERNTTIDIYYAGSTFVEFTALESEDVTASSGVTVGTELANISSTSDVSVIIPVGASSHDATVTISRLKNPQKVSLNNFSTLYEFGPSGMEFDQPVTIIIPYDVATVGNSPSAYWYDPLTDLLSQQGITDIETIEISSTLYALRFKTTHFTQFLVGGGIAAAAGGGGGGGGCSISPHSQGSIVEFLLPYFGLTVVMTILKLQDKRKKKMHDIAKSE